MLCYPCKNCIVGITCSAECDDFRSFLNDTADMYYLFTHGELVSYRELPKSIRGRVMDLAFYEGRASKHLYQQRREANAHISLQKLLS